MTHPFFEFFKKNRPDVNPDSSKWSSSWRRENVRWKFYRRSPTIKLPKPELGAITLETVLASRMSRREFNKKSIDIRDLGAILGWSAGFVGENPDPVLSRRPYPSGGAMYPVELYILAFNVAGVDVGAYHYNNVDHSLENIACADVDVLKQSFHYDFVKKAAAVIVFSFIKERSFIKYGNLSFKFGLIEAGHAGQNIYLVSEALSIGCSAIGAMEDEVLHRELDLDGEREMVFYAIALGRVDNHCVDN